MKNRGKKLLDYIRRHFAGTGIAAVTVAMVFTVVKGAAGQEADFDPGEIDMSFSSELSDLPDRTGYDLSGKGEDSEEVNRDSNHEQDEKEEEDKPEDEDKDEGPGLEEGESLEREEDEQVILPDGMTDDIPTSDTIDATVQPRENEPEDASGPDTDSHQGNGENGSSSGGGKGGSREDKTPSGDNAEGSDENNRPSGGNGGGSENDRPSGGNGEEDGSESDRPSGGNGEGGDNNNDPSGGNGEDLDTPDKPDDPEGGDQPGDDINQGDESEGKFSVVIDGEKKDFNSEDDALAWVVDNQGKNDNGQYFEGFIKDESGNFVPSYGDEDNFGSNGDVAWDYTGESTTFVVPEGTSALELAMISNNENIKIIVIHKNVTDIITEFGSSFTSLEKFVVSEDNPKYISIDGVLYLKTKGGGIELCMVPAAKEEIQKWPDRLTVVGGNSFYRSKMDMVELPDTVTIISDSAFGESSVGTLVLPEGVSIVGSFAFSYEAPAKGEEASGHKIIVKSVQPPQVTNTTFYWMDYNLEKHLGDATTEIIVPDSEGDKVYEAYLMTWAAALARRYGGEAGLQIIKTEDGAQERYEYYEENGKGSYRRKGEDESFFQEDSLGTYYVDKEGNKTLFQCTSTAAVVDFSGTGIVSVADGAFDGCSLMKAIKLPESLQTMPENIFANNEELKVIISYAPDPPAMELGVPQDCAIFVKTENLEGYEAAWGDQVRKVLGTTSETYSVTVSGLVFDTGATRLLDIPADMASLSVASYVTSIYDGAIADHTNLSSVTYSSTSKLKRIGEGAFIGCTKLASIMIPAQVTDVGEGAFTGCTGLTTVTWRTSAMVPDSCFEDCASLKSVGWGNSRVKAVGQRAFYGCISLTELSMPSTLEWIGDQAFDGREGSRLTLTFKTAAPPEWSGVDSIDGLTIYVPDSEATGDDIYLAYLQEWGDWLGEHPEEVLKTRDGAETRFGLLDPEIVEDIPVQSVLVEEIYQEEEKIEEDTEKITEEEKEEDSKESGSEEAGSGESSSENEALGENGSKEEDSPETDPGEEGSGETDPEEEDSEETDSGKEDSGEIDPEEEDSEETDSGKGDLGEIGTEEDSKGTDSEKEDSGETDLGKEDSGETDPEEEDSNEIDAEEEELDSGKTDSQETDLEGSGSGKAEEEEGISDEAEQENSSSQETDLEGISSEELYPEEIPSEDNLEEMGVGEAGLRGIDSEKFEEKRIDSKEKYQKEMDLEEAVPKKADSKAEDLEISREAESAQAVDALKGREEEKSNDDY
ncbi:leucine-rich repeat protein [Lachnospiraceae bacterium 62-35]